LVKTDPSYFFQQTKENGKYLDARVKRLEGTDIGEIKAEATGNSSMTGKIVRLSTEGSVSIQNTFEPRFWQAALSDDSGSRWHRHGTLPEF